MEKVFLSHSSADKTFVEAIAEKFGKDVCVYDKMCFETWTKYLRVWITREFSCYLYPMHLYSQNGFNGKLLLLKNG